MRLLICFYILLGLFELFQSLTHSIHSKSCLWNSSLEEGNQSQMSFLVEAWSCTTGKTWDGWGGNIWFLLNVLPGRLESPWSGHLLFCGSFLVFLTGTEAWEPLDERSWRKKNKNPCSFLLGMVQVLRRKHFYPSRIIHPWSLLNT